jgi:hypothetical protein
MQYLKLIFVVGLFLFVGGCRGLGMSEEADRETQRVADANGQWRIPLVLFELRGKKAPRVSGFAVARKDNRPAKADPRIADKIMEDMYGPAGARYVGTNRHGKDVYVGLGTFDRVPPPEALNQR